MMQQNPQLMELQKWMAYVNFGVNQWVFTIINLISEHLSCNSVLTSLTHFRPSKSVVNASVSRKLVISFILRVPWRACKQFFGFQRTDPSSCNENAIPCEIHYSITVPHATPQNLLRFLVATWRGSSYWLHWRTEHAFFPVCKTMGASNLQLNLHDTGAKRCGASKTTSFLELTASNLITAVSC